MEFEKAAASQRPTPEWNVRRHGDGPQNFSVDVEPYSNNQIVQSLQADVTTLPHQLHAGETLLISSDVRWVLSTVAIFQEQLKFLAFSKQVPDCCLPDNLVGQEVYVT